jgi:serine/threonine-protein phosphatase 6 regulatory ankyrin repeat subunit B
MNVLVRMIQDDDAEGIGELLQDDDSLVNLIEDDMTPLLWACQMNRPEIVASLLSTGADPNLTVDDGETPLHVAAFEKCDECVTHLLRAGAEANAKTEMGKTPLMNAAHAGSLSIINKLLQASADATVADAAGRTALHWAVSGEHDDPTIARALISAGTKAGHKNLNGDTALDYARRLKRLSLERELASGRTG